MVSEDNSAKKWWLPELDQFSYYFQTFSDPLDQQRAQKRVQHILEQHQGNIEETLSFIMHDRHISARWYNQYSTLVSDGKTYRDSNGRWKPYATPLTNGTPTEPSPPESDPLYKHLEFIM